MLGIAGIVAAGYGTFVSAAFNVSCASTHTAVAQRIRGAAVGIINS